MIHGGKNTMKKLILAILAIMLLGFAMVSAANYDITSLDAQTGDISDTVSYTLEITNNEVAEDIATIACSADTDLIYNSYTIEVPTILDITNVLMDDGVNDNTATVQFDVTIPATGIEAGIYTTTVTCDDGLDQEQATLQLTVNAVDAFTNDISAITVDILPNNNDDETISVTNTGSTTLTNFAVDFLSDNGDDPICTQNGPCYMEDNDGDQITLTFTNIPSSLSPGDSAEINMNVDVEDNVDYGEDYDGTLTISTGALSQTVDLAVN